MPHVLSITHLLPCQLSLEEALVSPEMEKLTAWIRMNKAITITITQTTVFKS